MKTVLFSVIVFIFFIVQTTAFNLAPGKTPWPDFALLLAIYGGLRWGKVKGTQVGAAIGLVQDFLSFEAMGAHFLSKALIGFMVGKLREKYIHDSQVSRSILVLCASVFDILIYGAIIKTFLGYSLSAHLGAGALPQTLINLAFSFLVLPLIGWADLRLDKLLGRTKGKYLDIKSEF